jgi:ABC-2 type transport system ATP-binding protein
MLTNIPSSALKQRLQEIANYYQQGDVSLGYRRLMDAAIDTNNSDIFNEVCNHTEWLCNNPSDDTIHWQKAATLIEHIAHAGVHLQKEIGTTILAANGIQKKYKNGVFSLGPIDLELKRGMLLGLVGENGNGKTTLLRILAQELKSDSGEVRYNISQQHNQYALRTQLAYIPQRTPKWYGSLKDNLKFTLSSYGINGADNEARVLMIIARMGLWNYRNLNWNQLSSGYKMRFELARTFLRCPDILLLDEPLANLDVMAQQTMLEDLKSLANSLSAPMGLILSSQQLYEVEKVSDRVLFLKNGKAVWQEHSDIMTSTDTEENKQLIIEFDTDTDRQHLNTVLQSLPLEKLQFNGGTYIAYFSAPTSMAQILTVLGKAEINVVYIRNISQSTRRFFVAS